MSGNSCGQKTDIRENGYGNYYFFHRIEFGAWQFAKRGFAAQTGGLPICPSRRFRMLTAIRLLILMHICTRRLRQKTLFLDVWTREVLERLDAWNREIRVEFLRAIKNMCPGIGAGHLPPEDELPMDTDMTYQLVCATRELDDMWYDFADHAVYVENEFGYPFFRTIVDEHTAACIKANPEAYLIARVTPKWIPSCKQC